MGILDMFKKSFEPKTDVVPPPREEYPSGEVKIREKEFDKLSSRYPFLLLEFQADWCAPCQHMKPKVKWLAKELRGKVVVGTVNVERQKKLAQRFRVRGIPRMILLHYGQQVESWTGAMDITRLSKELLRYHGRWEEAVSDPEKDR